MKYFVIFFFIFQFYSLSFANNSNYYEIKYSKNDLKKIKKVWTYSSKVLKATQNKLVQYEDKLIHLDGKKNLIVLNLSDGSEVCKNIGKSDRAPYRGINLYIKNPSKKEVFAIFPRHSEIKLINIFNCVEKKLPKKIIQKSLSAPILIYENKAIMLPNGHIPISYDLNSGNIVWKAKIDKKNKQILKKYNNNIKLHWDVWGGGVIDKKFDQIIFSTANAKPAYSSKGREGPNLFYNSIVSLDIQTGKYKWHFQEIEHDILNLDMASAPVILDKENKHYVAQATKSGQLIILDRLTGKAIEKFVEKKFYHTENKKIYTTKRIFQDWLQFSRNNFLKEDINNLTNEFSDEARMLINTSIISEYKTLSSNKNYIHYGFHGGNEWPGISVTPKGDVLIPGNNIAWVSKLRDPSEFNLLVEINLLFKNSLSIFTFDFNKFKMNTKKTLSQFRKIVNYKKINIEKYQRFVNDDGIPLNSPPWGTITSINVFNKKKNWQIPHGHYPKLDKKYKNTGSEIFGCPVSAGENIFFMSGTRDKKIYAYNTSDGKLLWEDELPYVGYGCPIISEYNNNFFLIINSSGGSKFRDAEYGDKVIAYMLR
jgi:quinoprotein glucose dehydrogenase